MSWKPVNILDNPYASPQLAAAAQPTQSAALAARSGSLLIIVGGFFLLLAGYVTSNLFLISDLYQIGMGPGGEQIPSPFAVLGSTPQQSWLLYGLSAGAAIAGCVMLGSQAFNSLAVVCYVLCPLAAGVWLAGSPLRIAQKYAFPVAALYLTVGSSLAGTGIIRLIALYGQPQSDGGPIVASMMAEAGLALVAGALLKVARLPATNASAGQGLPAAGALAGSTVKS